MGTIFSPPPDFNRPLARQAAALVQNAYDQYIQGANWRILPGYEILAVLEAKPEGWIAQDERFGFIAREQASGDLFVTLRGTQSPEDWLSNLTFPQVSHPWGMVERGFSLLYSQCSTSVRQTVANAAPARVVVTGHSLGGALATLATADLVLAGINPLMYTFASPRTGNVDFAAKFNQSVPVKWRVANTEDIVTTVPLATIELETIKADALHMIVGLAEHLGQKVVFQHVGTPVNFTTHNFTVIDNHRMPTYSNALVESAAAVA